MGHGTIILEQWQEDENLIDLLLKNRKISKIGYRWTNHAMRAAYYYSAESDFFKGSVNRADDYYYPTCKVVEGELIECTMPLDVHELEAAEKLLKTLKEEKSALKATTASLSFDAGKLEGEKDILTSQLTEITKLIKEKQSDLSNIKDKITALDSKKIDKISNVVVNIVGILDEVELKGTGSVINALYNDLGELKKLTSIEE